MPRFVHARAFAFAIGLVLLAACPAAGQAAKEPKPAAAAPAAAAPAALTLVTFPVERHVLPNGLVVLMHEDHSVPTISFWQWYRVGSRNERPGITGISHFFEHMMFNGSKNVPPKEYDRILESNGGYSNAFTDRDMTAYYEDIASDRLDVVLKLDSDRMAALSLLPEQMKSEMEVVKEERRLRTDNDHGARRSAVCDRAARVAVSLAGDRLDGRPQPDHARRVRGLLPHVLRPEQLHPRSRGRLQFEDGTRRDHTLSWCRRGRGTP
jgi:hypothetical protein